MVSLVATCGISRSALMEADDAEIAVNEGLFTLGRLKPTSAKVR
jgi:hypothetical protein